jgi:hypothetical protein
MEASGERTDDSIHRAWPGKTGRISRDLKRGFPGPVPFSGAHVSGIALIRLLDLQVGKWLMRYCPRDWPWAGIPGLFPGSEAGSLLRVRTGPLASETRTTSSRPRESGA